MRAVLLSLMLVACVSEPPSPSSEPKVGVQAAAAREEADPPQANVGRLFFRETRFAQFHFANVGADVNAPLDHGEPQLAGGPYAGKSTPCAGCHFIDEAGSPRAYADFAARSALPERGDGKHTTLRNSQTLVGVMRPRRVATVFHNDGDFADMFELVRAGLTGRNLGWLPDERASAVAHIARIVREDASAVPYRTLLLGTDPAIPTNLRLPADLRVDVATASDTQILDAVATLITEYMTMLSFARSELGMYTGSPYDAFVLKNRLPARPLAGQSAADYVGTLTAALDALKAPAFVDEQDGKLELHGGQRFVFGAEELRGLRLFLGSAQCAACHPPPELTDFALHNTGAAQAEYDGLHGEGAFARMPVPTLAARSSEDLTRLRSLPAPDAPDRTDLGAWTVFGNPRYPDSQIALAELLCPDEDCPPETTLARAFAAFKTPSVRDLVDSEPYLHTGALGTLESVVRFYQRSARLAREGALREPAPEMARIVIEDADIAPLVAFLMSLTEDYQ